MADENANCRACKKITVWRQVRKHWKCTGCDDVYPCRHACKHFDCMETRGEVKADEHGFLRPV